MTCGRSWTAQGGKASPADGASSPVALATAVVSIAGFEPSRKQVNMRGLRPPALASASERPQSFHTVSGVVRE